MRVMNERSDPEMTVLRLLSSVFMSRVFPLPPLGVTGHGLGLRVDLELLIDAADVGMHGVPADARYFRDLLLRMAACQQVKNLALAFREFLLGCFRGKRGLECLGDPPGDAAAHRGAAGLHEPQRSEQLFLAGALEQSVPVTARVV